MSYDVICSCGATEVAIIGTTSRPDGRYDLHTECSCGSTNTYVGCTLEALSYPPDPNEALVEDFAAPT
jgi:hypothetical protein